AGESNARRSRGVAAHFVGGMIAAGRKEVLRRREVWPWRPRRWSWRSYEHMLARHDDLAISAEQRLTFVTLLSRAADDAGLPRDPEFCAAFMGTRSGVRGWRSTTPSPAPRRSRTLRCHVGAGESPHPTKWAS